MKQIVLINSLSDKQLSLVGWLLFYLKWSVKLMKNFVRNTMQPSKEELRVRNEKVAQMADRMIRIEDGKVR